MSLFGGAATGRASSQYLVEFKAGKLFMKPGNMVTPDKKNGLVYVYQSDDSLMHFCWKDRGTGEVVDDLIIFPDDVMFKHIPPAKISAARCDRIYVLKFKASSRKFFFWMQEPKSDKDEENATKVNNLLNNPPAPGSRAAGGGAGSSLGSLGDLEGLGESRVGADLQSLLGNMSQQQLMQLLASGGLSFGGLPGLLGGNSSRPSTGQSLTGSTPTSASGSRPSAAAPATATATSTTTPAATATTASSGAAPTAATTASTATASPAAAASPAASARATSAGQGSNPIRLTDLQSILSSMNLPAGASDEVPVDLAGVITPENMAPILNDQETNDDLLPHLPQGEGLGQTPDELRQTLGSPQFQQAMGSFQAALQSGQLGPLMNQFGMTADVSAAASQGNVEAFMQAMEQDDEEAEEDKEKEKKKEEKKEDDFDLDE